MRTAIMAALGLCVSACSASGPTVEYYKANPKLLDKRLDECIASGDRTQDCRNAKRAYADLHGFR